MTMAPEEVRWAAHIRVEYALWDMPESWTAVGQGMTEALAAKCAEGWEVLPGSIEVEEHEDFRRAVVTVVATARLQRTNQS